MHGIVAQPQLNGTQGVVTGYSPSNDPAKPTEKRVNVAIAVTGKTYALKPTCCMVVSSAAAIASAKAAAAASAVAAACAPPSGASSSTATAAGSAPASAAFKF